ncbi:hypothetical protein RBH26_00055 [Natronolimnohabitans sp. A-GB9]|uniref:hypothetical protein n=1 Tax=Natronolimnohabitans sp. A-GB9 TaxID=3069757 RepID=UPI0027B5FDE7|nr:hypothetical protein [Natronolimnohabitans sp. A-GB9]MDQ2048870.1 hypothetical protein [Natronolimnohabitans sp. A-GB9]
MGDQLKRRPVIAAGGTGVIGALAGCVSSLRDPSGDDTGSGSVYTVSLEPVGNTVYGKGIE